MPTPSKNDLDLNPRDINLLPDEMRLVEERVKRSSGSKEKLYQLRLPKKTKHGRRRFAWLPFFGGQRWEIPADVAITHEKKDAEGGIAQAVIQKQGTGPQPVRNPSSAPAQRIISPHSGIASSMSPKVLPARKRGIFAPFLLWIFGGGRSTRPTQPRGIPTRVNGNAFPSSTLQTEPRHYSLIPEKKPMAQAIPQRPNIIPQSASTTGNVPLTASTGQPPRPITPQPVHKKRQGMAWPKWLDIFSLFALLGAKKKPLPAKPISAQPATQPIVPQTPERVMSIENYSKLQHKPGDPITPIVEQKKDTIEQVMPAMHPLTPEARGAMPKPRKQRKPFLWPKWLDIFYIFGLLTTKKKKQPLPQMVKKITDIPIVKPLPASQKSMTPSITPIVEAKPADAPRSAPSVGAVTPERMSIKPLAPKPAILPQQHIRKPWMLPRWLVALLGIFKRKPKAPKSIPPKPLPKATPVAMPTITPRQDHPSAVPATVAPTSPITPKTSDQPSATNIETTHVTQKQHTELKPIDDPSDKKKSSIKVSQYHYPEKKNIDPIISRLGDINFVPNRNAVLRSWQQLGIRMAIVCVITSAILGSVYGALVIYEFNLSQRTTKIDQQIQTFQNDIKAYDEKILPRMTDLSDRLDLIQNILNKHVYWTHFFALLEKYTLPDVYFDGISATTNGTLSLSAHGSSFQTVSQQLLLLQSQQAKEFVDSVAIRSAHAVQVKEKVKRIDFSIELTLNPNLFYYGGAR